MKDKGKGIWTIIFAFLAVWIVIRYLFPLIFPFLIGWGMAELAEPGVKFLHNRMKWRRTPASVVSVGVGLLGLAVLLMIVGAMLYREITVLWQSLPGTLEELSGMIMMLRDSALDALARAPEGLAEPLTRVAGNLFAGGNVLIEKLAAVALGKAGGFVSGIPGGALTVGTAVISAFMISVQLPVLKQKVRESRYWKMRLEPLVQRCREAVGCWIKAQIKLIGFTFGIVAAGLLFLGNKNILLWAGVIALVDAIPMLGTGTILVPWSILCFLRSDPVRGIGLLGIYLISMLVRSALEPRVVGHQLGINPLLTLVALYAGFQLWGVGGMILAPIITVTAGRLTLLDE